MRAVELRVAGGRVVLAGVPLTAAPDGRRWGLPDELVAGLEEWARVASRPTGDDDAVAVSRRGRHLAARVSVALRVPVDYVDPVNGVVVALRAVTRVAREAPAPAAEERTPWGPGLAVAVVVAGLVTVADVALASSLVAGLGWLGVLLDVVVAAGLVPALWLNRGVPTWRWAVLGTLAGLALAVPFLLVRALG